MATAASNSPSETLPMKEQLTAATTLEEVEEIVIESFIAKLRTSLRLPTEESISPATALIEFGIDSLVAV